MRRVLWRFPGLIVLVGALLLVTAVRPGATRATDPGGSQRPTLAPFVPTPHDVVDRMLELARVASGDVVVDLGSGDGRLVVTAARRFGARGIGIDIDPARIAEGRANATAAGVDSLVEFRQQDAMEADVSQATVVTLYLLSSSNVKLRPRLLSQLKPGARIVSHQFGMGDWPPDKVETFTDSNGTSRTLYLWTVGANAPRP
jgi:SAM-dependent methyltransferase